MSVRLADVIAVLDDAYPPHLAHDWDSVGLVCGDPDESVDSVTVAVDATAAVVETVGRRGLLLAHHPLLLRGVDTVAASTPKGALIHRLIRSDAALFTAHTNADAASPGVSDALAAALGLTVEAVLDPAAGGPPQDRWVILVPPANAETLRQALFAAGAGTVGNYTHCSWSVVGDGQFRPEPGAHPVVGTVGTMERGPEERLEVLAPAALRARLLAAIRAAHPYEEPSFDVYARTPMPDGVGGRRSGSAGVAGRGLRRLRRFPAGGGAGGRGAGLCDRGPAPPPGRRTPPGQRRRPGRRRALGQRIPVVRPGGRSDQGPFRRRPVGDGVAVAHRSVEHRDL